MILRVSLKTDVKLYLYNADGSIILDAVHLGFGTADNRNHCLAE
jgi:hypothetical protein